MPGPPRRAVAAALLALCACPVQGTADPPRGEAGQDVTAESFVPPPLEKGHVTLESAFGGQAAVEVELARSPEAIERGLMWRRELPAGKGMLFVFPEVRDHTFWMKNTLIPLDMIFIGPDNLVVGVVENAQPRTLRSRRVGVPSRYVLEVPGGWAARAGVSPGSRVTLKLPGGP